MEDPTIIALLEKQDKRMDSMESNLKDFFQTSMMLNQAKIFSKLETIEDTQEELVEQKKEQNGRIGKLETQTRFFRMMHRNPGKSIIAAMLVLMLGAYSYHKINLKKTFENWTKIELEHNND